MPGILCLILSSPAGQLRRTGIVEKLHHQYYLSLSVANPLILAGPRDEFLRRFLVRRPAPRLRLGSGSNARYRSPHHMRDEEARPFVAIRKLCLNSRVPARFPAATVAATFAAAGHARD